MTTLTAETIPGYRTGTWTVDHAHTEIGFSVRHLAISKVKGVFESFDATVTAAENPLDSSVTVTVDMASINTKNADRDAHLRTNDFFAPEQFPTMTFRSTAAAGCTSSTWSRSKRQPCVRSTRCARASRRSCAAPSSSSAARR